MGAHVWLSAVLLSDETLQISQASSSQYSVCSSSGTGAISNRKSRHPITRKGFRVGNWQGLCFSFMACLITDVSFPLISAGNRRATGWHYRTNDTAYHLCMSIVSSGRGRAIYPKDLMVTGLRLRKYRAGTDKLICRYQPGGRFLLPGKVNLSAPGDGLLKREPPVFSDGDFASH